MAVCGGYFHKQLDKVNTNWGGGGFVGGGGSTALLLRWKLLL